MIQYYDLKEMVEYNEMCMDRSIGLEIDKADVSFTNAMYSDRCDDPSLSYDYLDPMIFKNYIRPDSEEGRVCYEECTKLSDFTGKHSCLGFHTFRCRYMLR